MNRRQVGSSDLTGMLAVLASTVSVVLVVVATVTDRPVLLGVAALVVAVAVTLVVVRRSAPRRRPDSVTDPIEASGTPWASGPPEGHHEDDQAGAAEQYHDEAVTARSDLLATLRHGFRADADRGGGPHIPSAEREPDVGTGVASRDPSTTGDGPATAPASPGMAPRPIDPPPDDHRTVAPDRRGTFDAVGTGPDPLFDAATGLFTQGFFEASLPKRVSAARRGLRPLSVAAIDVVAGRPDAQATSVDRAVVAAAMTEVFRDADTIAITDGGLFVVLLEDTPEAGAVWTLERLRRHLTEEDAHRTMWAGVSCYPAYSFDAEGLIGQAQTALESARQWQQDRIEIADHPSE